MGRMISIPQLSLSEALNASTSKIFSLEDVLADLNFGGLH